MLYEVITHLAFLADKVGEELDGAGLVLAVFGNHGNGPAGDTAAAEGRVRALGIAGALDRDVNRVRVFIVQGVITSYSIHYTKLYDGLALRYHTPEIRIRFEGVYRGPQVARRNRGRGYR